MMDKELNISLRELFVFKSAWFAELRIQMSLEIGMNVSFIATFSYAVILGWNTWERKDYFYV
jgi:hypothetical protein